MNPKRAKKTTHDPSASPSTSASTTTIPRREVETFESLCLTLGRYCSEAERGLLCYRAHQAYLKDHPETAQGKAPKGKARPASFDRDPSFREAAAKLAEVSRATIDALLHVGKALVGLPATTTAAAKALPQRCLRKLARDEHDGDRVKLLDDFAKRVEADPKSARSYLDRSLGLIPKARTATEAKPVTPTTTCLAAGDHHEVKVGRTLLRISVRSITAGRVDLEIVPVTPVKKNVAAFLKMSPAPEAVTAAEIATSARLAATSARLAKAGRSKKRDRKSRKAA